LSHQVVSRRKRTNQIFTTNQRTQLQANDPSAESEIAMKNLRAFWIAFVFGFLGTIGTCTLALAIMPTIYPTETECLNVHSSVEMAQLTANYIDNGKLPWYSKLICNKTGANK
jgi:hypothetical protein